ncbi:MAG: restriction endonuclease subunit S [Oscillospiraceae bacterium]|nr:restriction endonuclease subunit S [Oscillospiraceae bacterium]
MNFTELVTSKGLFCDGDWIEKKDQDPNGAVRLIQLADIGVCEFKDKSNRFITEAKAKERNCTYLQKGDILIARLPDPLGRACIFPLKGKYITAVDVAIVRISRNDVNPKYIMYMINSPGFHSEIVQYESGTTRKRISRRNLDKIEFAIPSLYEQNRIVARIEELFSELDNGVETLRKTKQQLAVYRQAVVKSVLDIYCKDAEVVQISDVCHDVKVGIVIKPTQYYVQSGGVRAFRNANVRRNFIEDNDWAMISQEGHKQNSRSEIHTGDVLIARSGVNLGMAAAVPEQYNGYNAIDVVIAVPNQDLVLSRYLAYYTNSPYGISSVKRNQRGVAQGHLNITVYGKLPLMLPTIEVQESVIQEIDARLSACDNIEKSVDTALQQAEAMRQSILKQAFEGNL